MTNKEILDQLNKLTALVESRIGDNSFDDGDGTTEYITEDDGTTYLRAGQGYSPGVAILSTATDTGNGFIFYFPSHSNCIQDNYICMDYAEADYIRKMLCFLQRKQELADYLHSQEK